MRRFILCLALLAVPVLAPARPSASGDGPEKEHGPTRAAASAALVTAPRVTGKSRNAFGQAMAELTRVAREQAAAARGASSPAIAGASTRKSGAGEAPAMAASDRR